LRFTPPRAPVRRLCILGRHFEDAHAYSETNREISVAGKDWWVSASPLEDAEEKIGDLLVIAISPPKASLLRACWHWWNGRRGTLAPLLGLSTCCSPHRRGIRAQQAKLQENEEQFRPPENALDGVYMCDFEATSFTVNQVRRDNRLSA
jgi:hypothetical protein